MKAGEPLLWGKLPGTVQLNLAPDTLETWRPRLKAGSPREECPSPQGQGLVQWDG